MQEQQPDPQTEARLATEAAPAGHLEEVPPLGKAPSCDTKTDRGRTAVLRQDARNRHARADAAVRALPPASPPR